MFWGKSYLFVFIGLFIIFFGVSLTWFLPLLFCVPMFIIGPIFCFFSVALIHWRARNTTLDLLLEPDEKPDERLWLYIWGDNEIEVMPTKRVGEKQTYNRALDQQAKTFKTYRFANHSVYLIPEGLGHSVDAGAGLYCQVARDKWRVNSLSQLRKLFNPRKFSKPKVYDTKDGVPDAD